MESQVRVKWNTSMSAPFNVSNGVRQGAVLSPNLFNIYVDELIKDLKTDGRGCWVGAQFYGVLVYADDILLLSPTVSALKSMIKTCEDFGHKTGLEFNSKKTVCILFHQLGHCNDTNTPNVYLNDKALKWCQHVKHLGHIISCCSDIEEETI